jgi:hypothetical protein
MGLSWGQGKIELKAFSQEIHDFLTEGLTESEIFRRLKAKGLAQGKRTFHRSIKVFRAEQQPAALPVPVPKSQAPKVSDKQPDQPSRPEPSSQHEGQTKRGAFYKSTQRDPRSLI